MTIFAFKKAHASTVKGKDDGKMKNECQNVWNFR